MKNWLLQNIPKLNIFIDLELDRKNGLLGKNIQDIDRGLLLQSLSLIPFVVYSSSSGWCRDGKLLLELQL